MGVNIGGIVGQGGGARNPGPTISVVIEGYNESIGQGRGEAALEALRQQDFPLNTVEVILAGSCAQARAWRNLERDPAFHSIRAIGADGGHYYELKNLGAEAASGEIIALMDTDVRPEANWLSRIASGIGDGADVVAGLTLFRRPARPGWERSLVAQAAASISWGFVAGPDGSAAGFLSHNVAFRSGVFHRHPFRTDLGRTCAGSFLYAALAREGVKIVLQPEQRVAHDFAPGWWLNRLHARFGHEIFLLRRLNPDARHRWLSNLAVLEPALSVPWRVLADVPKWFRFGGLLGLGLTRRMVALPLLFPLSLAVHTAEMAGMYLTLLAPARMRRFAESA
ncbi:MAG: glycosyltransferase [Bryobacteraceae bacterium]